MGLGKNRAERSAQALLANIPSSRQYIVNTPDGDQIVHDLSDGLETITPVYSPQKQSLINKTQQAIDETLGQLQQTPTEELTQANQYRDQFFERLSRAINQSSDYQMDKTKSDLAKRFGGAYGSTFGNDLLSRLENNRANALTDAQLDSEKASQDYLSEQNKNRYLKLSSLGDQLGRLQSSVGSLLPDVMRSATADKNLDYTTRTNVIDMLNRNQTYRQTGLLSGLSRLLPSSFRLF